MEHNTHLTCTTGIGASCPASLDLKGRIPLGLPFFSLHDIPLVWFYTGASWSFPFLICGRREGGVASSVGKPSFGRPDWRGGDEGGGYSGRLLRSRDITAVCAPWKWWVTEWRLVKSEQLASGLDSFCLSLY